MSVALTLPSTLDADVATSVVQRLIQEIRAVSGSTATGGVVLDASALTVFDSSALAVMLACRREAQELRHSFAVHGMVEPLKSLASLYGVLDLLQPTAS